MLCFGIQIKTLNVCQNGKRAVFSLVTGQAGVISLEDGSIDDIGTDIIDICFIGNDIYAAKVHSETDVITIEKCHSWVR